MAKQKATPKTKQVSASAAVSDDQFRSLRTWNLRLAVLFLVQAFAVAVIGTAKTAPVTTSYLATDPLASEATGQQVLAVASRELFGVRMGWLVAAFLLVFALVYLAVATIYRNRYEARLKQGMNDFRWLGLGLGGGMMLVTIALLSGVHEMSMLIMLFVAMLGGSLAILAAEEIARREQQKKALLSHVVCAVGTLGLVVPWVVLTIVAGGALLYDGTIPSYLWGIYASMFVLFAAGFALTHFRIEQKGWAADTLRAERAYMALSFLAASALAWQIFAGVLQP